MAGAAFVRLSEWLLPAEDPDVGVYLHVAYAWLHGNLPYVTAWEYKPPGLFALYAAALRICGEPALAVQSLATLATWATALALWRLAPLIDPNGGQRSGRYAAIFAIMLSPENEGYLGDAEVLVAPFIAWAFVLALRQSARPRVALWVGLLCGAALQMKLTALPLIVPPILTVAARSRGRPLRTLALAVCAVVAPFAIESALYAASGRFAALWDANVGATLGRLGGLHRGIVAENAKWLPRQVRILAPAVELAILAIGLRGRGTAWIATWGWLAAAVLAVVGPGEFYNRQFVLVQAPIALLGGIGLRIASDWAKQRARALAAFALIATFALHDYWKTEQAVVRVQHWIVLGDRHWREPHYYRVLSMLHDVPHGSSIYIIQLTPLLYDALGLRAPTRFADSDLLLETRMAGMIGRSGHQELRRIFARKPLYVVVGGPLTEPRFNRDAVTFVHGRLTKDYRAVARTNSAILYERRQALAVQRPHKLTAPASP